MKINKILILFGFLISSIILSCKSGVDSKTVQSDSAEFDILLNYLEQTGDYINSSEVPSNINAADVFRILDKNILIIDVRDEEAYNAGHIKGARNIMPDMLLQFFETVIEPNSYDTIIFVCDIGVRSGFVAGVFRLLGFNNVFSMKFGMSAWHSQYAESLWLNALSSHMEDKMEIATHLKPDTKYYPEIHTGKTTGYDILKERAKILLSTPLKNFFISIDDFNKAPSKYFIVKYWDEKYNTLPQLKTAYQFTPRMSLNSKNDLYLLPVNQPILIYCNMGLHSSFVVAFLRILGYDAYSLKYGANSFMYQIMQNNIPENAFSRSFINNFPLETSKETPTIEQTNNTVKVQVKGGC